MEKEFVPYQPSLDLRELGFDEPCFSYYYNRELSFGAKTSYGEVVEAPTFSQAFRWFREKYELTSEVCIEQYRRKTNKKWMFSITYLNEDAMYEHSKTTFENYEEAELECLKRLIEIVRQKLAQVKN